MDHTSYLLGKLVTLSEATMLRLTRIEKRLDRLEKRKPEVSPTERIVKFAMTAAAPLFTFWATGSAEKATEVLRALLAR